MRNADDDLGARFDCVDQCVASRRCGELRGDFCAPKSAITDYERCVAACLSVSNDALEERAPTIGFAARCPDGGGGGHGRSSGKPNGG